jgi:predicted TIM-barrel fold metal-dependent hydrolase
VYGRSPADEYFDPFWARVAEAGVPVAFHAGDAGYNELVTTLWGEPGRLPSRKMSAFQMYLGHHRPIMDTLAALVLQNLFTRFPTLRVVSIEQGSEWVPSLLRELDLAYRSRRELPERPSDVFRRHVWIAPFHEEDILELVELIGPDHVLFGSDYPHPEGLAPPSDFLDALEPLPADAQRRIVCDNTAELLHLV